MELGAIFLKIELSNILLVRELCKENHDFRVRWLTHVYIARPQCVNTLRPRQNGRHFPDDIFECIFLNENVFISIKISLKFVPKGQINNICCWSAPSHYLNQGWEVYWRIYASLGLNELNATYVDTIKRSSMLDQRVWLSSIQYCATQPKPC